MSYSNKTESGCCWWISGVSVNQSGCKVDYIYGVQGIGSPHGHLVTFNEQFKFNRPVYNLTAFFSGSEIIIEQIINSFIF